MAEFFFSLEAVVDGAPKENGALDTDSAGLGAVAVDGTPKEKVLGADDV